MIPCARFLFSGAADPAMRVFNVCKTGASFHRDISQQSETFSLYLKIVDRGALNSDFGYDAPGKWLSSRKKT
jgi:hypothetical protein